MSTDPDVLSLISQATEDTSAPGIARAISRLVTAGAIRPGDHLPTVRQTAAAFGISSSTVSTAWRLMQEHGLISTDRRRGTVVRSSRGSIDGRYWQVPVPAGTFAIDVSTGTPDRTLLPDLGVILHRIHANVSVGSYVDPPVLTELEAELRDRWPFQAEHMTIVDGAQDALDRLIGALIQIGDRVVVEEPTFPPLLDMLELAGAEVIGVPLDDQGLDLARLADAVATAPAAVILQPRAHNPTGVNMSAKRAKAIAKMLGPDIWVIEDDHSGAAAGVQLNCIAAHRPERSLLIRSYSKSHGPDLRIAAIGGASAPLRTLERRRALGPSWTSRLLQQILLEMLTDPVIEAEIQAAATVYQQRRNALTAEMARHDIVLAPGSGLNATIPVQDEQVALVYLAAHGIGVAPGKPFLTDPTKQAFVRVTIGSYQGDIAELAEVLAAASRATPRNQRLQD